MSGRRWLQGIHFGREPRRCLTDNRNRSASDVRVAVTRNGGTMADVGSVQASAPGLSEAQFQELAAGAKAGCPLSKALASVPEITLTATLK